MNGESGYEEEHCDDSFQPNANRECQFQRIARLYLGHQACFTDGNPFFLRSLDFRNERGMPGAPAQGVRSPAMTVGSTHMKIWPLVQDEMSILDLLASR